LTTFGGSYLLSAIVVCAVLSGAMVFFELSGRRQLPLVGCFQCLRIPSASLGAMQSKNEGPRCEIGLLFF
jgi:hypothetical protein